MRHAMAQAVVGDLVLGYDANVEQLEQILASYFGMFALWMPTCTMANLVALLLSGLGGPTEMIVGATSHVYALERKNVTTFAGVALRAVPDEAGRLDLEAVESLLTQDSEFTLTQSCIALENTHNLAGGAVFAPDYLKTVFDLAGRRCLRVHVDGARIFNASVAAGVPLDAWHAPTNVVQSMSISLSKALSTPGGAALLLSSDAELSRARWYRKALGGTMHCGAGILAAAAVAVLNPEGMVRIRDEIMRMHRTAAVFAFRVEEIGSYEVVIPPATNIVYVRNHGKPVEATVRLLAEEGIACTILSPIGLGSIGAVDPRPPIRFVFHRGIGEPEVDRVLSCLRRINLTR